MGQRLKRLWNFDLVGRVAERDQETEDNIDGINGNLVE